MGELCEMFRTLDATEQVFYLKSALASPADSELGPYLLC